MGTPKTVGEDPFGTKFGMHWLPNEDFMYISRRFYFHWDHIIAGHDALAIDPKGNTRPLRVGFTNGRPAFTTGWKELVDFYSLTAESLFHFFFFQPLTFRIRIFDNDGTEIDYPDNGNAPEVIILDSDDESQPQGDNESQAEADDEAQAQAAESDDEVQVMQNDPVITWEKIVIERMAQGRNPLNLPARVVQRLLLHGRTRLNVRVAGTSLVANCKIRFAERNKNEGHLITGWYELCKDLRLSAGNMLHFTFVPDELHLLLRVVRNN